MEQEKLNRLIDLLIHSGCLTMLLLLHLHMAAVVSAVVFLLPPLLSFRI